MQSFIGKAQELANYNLYMQNTFLYNPAYSIDKTKMRAFVNSQIQWVGFEGGPRVNTFGIHGPISENSGIGLSVKNNSSGLVNNFSASLSYAFRAKFTHNHYLQLGASGGLTADRLGSPNQFTDLTDQVLTDETFSDKSFLTSAGLTYFYNGLTFQFILPQLYRRKEMSWYKIAIVDYNHNINSEWDVKPSVLFRHINSSPVQFDINLMGMWNKLLWAQLGYRSNKSFILGIGTNLKEFELGYAYQLDNSDVARVSNGTHEIQLVYNFGENLLVREKRTVIEGKITNIANGQPVSAKLKISEKSVKGVIKASSDSTGQYSLDLKQKKTYKIRVVAKDYYSKNLTVSSGKNKASKIVNIELTPKKTMVAGKVLRIDNNQPVSAKITISENGKQIASVQSNASNGRYSVNLLSGKSYKLTISDPKYLPTEKLISIKTKTANYNQDLFVEAYSIIKGTITGSKNNAKLNAKVYFYKDSTQIESFEAIGDYSKKLKKEGIYTFEFNAKDYFSKNITIDLKDADDEIIKNIQLNKIEKGKAFQLGNICFNTGTADLLPESFIILDKMVKIMKDNPELKAEILGHTDDEGSTSFNQVISERRAEACANYLSSKGIDVSRFKCTGFGESTPLKPNTSRENKAINRRVEFKLFDN